MRAIGRSLYAQIAALYLVLTLIFCTVLVGLTVRQFGGLLAEVQQRLNHDLAANLATQLTPDLSAGLQSDQARQAIRRVREINPALDIYLLTDTGRVAAAYSNATPPADAQIDLAPVRAFISGETMLPITAMDPGDPGVAKVFSAAPLQVPNERAGYLFIILHGNLVDTASGMLRDSYIIRGVAFALFLLLLSVTAVGLIAFALLTRRFRRLIHAVQGISAGNYEQRISVERDDEIGRLGQSVNEMAEMIQTKVEALRRTDEERRTLLANLSHDFRTPLTSLRGYTQRLATRQDELDTTARDECLHAVLSNTEQLEHMIAQLATLSELDGHGQTAQPEPFSLGELVQDVVLKFRPAAARRELKLEYHAPALPDVLGDIGLIERVLSNLIDNALGNTPPGGQVDITLERATDGVRLVVVDTGCGIAAEELTLVTRRFYRVERGRAPTTTGTGLGLAIAREILELHDSELEIRSSVGVGSAIGFSLKAVEEDH